MLFGFGVLLQTVSDGVNWFWGLPSYAWLFFLIITAFALAWLVERVGIVFLKAWARGTTTQIDDLVLHAIHPPVAVILFVVFVWTGLRYLPLGLGALTTRIIDNAGITVIVFAGALGFARLLRGLLQLPGKRDERWLGLSLIGSRVVAITVYTVAFLVVLNEYGIAITPMLTALGVGGIAVALALQDTLNNMFSGIWIQTQKAMRPGHFIKVEELNLDGFVEDVGWRTTKIRTLPGNIIEMPNKTVANSTITDFFQPVPKMGTSLTITTGFEADPEKIVPMMLEECMAASDEVSFVLKDPAPAARLNKATDNGWEFWMSIWVPFYYHQWNAQGYVLNRIRKRFLKEGVRMPYPIRETYTVEQHRPDVSEAITARRDHGGQGAEVPVATAVAEGFREGTGPGKIKVTR
ncbi:MAG TPA: mechanosensitive ion channel family protein [Candidatus Thermoplasmatota archaeon]